ncbi:aldo/keto reductase [Delftia sp. WSY_7]|uniref:aldo/keto reductase n=1 Tax=Delftia sp. WSY_7 TaxID=3367202 RepID=UPI00370CB881
MQAPQISFQDGHSIPQVGLGVWQTPQEATAQAVVAAFKAGYRHIDTAAVYENEAGVGDGIKEAGIPRSDIFITTKLWNSEQGADSTLKAFDTSMAKLGLEYLDLYLIHWPSPARKKYVETWKAFKRLQNEGRIRSIGVSNFEPEHLTRIIDETGVVPVLNQVELHPQFQQRELRAFHERHGIVTQAWSPLGQGRLLRNPSIEAIAKKHSKTAAQVIVRWHIELSNVVIPKSVNPTRIAENFDVFDFALDEDDLTVIAGLDKSDGRIGPNPLAAEF